LADAIAQRVGQQRFHVWFNNSTRMDLRQDGLEIAVPNDFISEWIGKNFTRPIQEAAHEVLGGPLPVRFCVVPELFEVEGAKAGEPIEGAQGVVKARVGGAGAKGKPTSAVVAARTVAIVAPVTAAPASNGTISIFATRPRLRHDIESYVVGPSNQLAY